jgi:hypothetical protein
VKYVRIATARGLAPLGYEHIEWLGGDGWAAAKTPQQVADDVGRGWQYYTDEDGSPRAYLERFVHNGRWFVRTKPDCTRANNLLSLTRF